MTYQTKIISTTKTITRKKEINITSSTKTTSIINSRFTKTNSSNTGKINLKAPEVT
jgi:hypothetical protein